MRNPRVVAIDWVALQRAFERLDATCEGEPHPYLNLRTGKVAYFGANECTNLSDTLDLDRHVALTLSDQALRDRHARLRAFIATVPEPELSLRLREALSQQGGIGTFYDILLEHPHHHARWQRAEAPRLYALIEEWLRSEGLEGLTAPPWRQ